MNKGYIYLHRKLLDNPVVMKDADHLAVWVYMLMKANHSSKDVWFGKERITVNRGQFITGRKVIAKDLGVNESKVYRIIKLLKSEHQIEQRVSNTSSLITILNYSEYQQVNNKVNNDRTTSEQRVNTTNKLNKLNTHTPVVPSHNNDLSKKVELGGDDFVPKFFTLWNPGSMYPPTSIERHDIVKYAKDYNSDIGFWEPYLNERMRRIDANEFYHSSIKAWCGGGFREYVAGKSLKQFGKPIFRKTKTGLYIAYCLKCGKKNLPNEYQLKGDSCCGTDWSPDPIAKQKKDKSKDIINQLGVSV